MSFQFRGITPDDGTKTTSNPSATNTTPVRVRERPPIIDLGITAPPASYLGGSSPDSSPSPGTTLIVGGGVRQSGGRSSFKPIAITVVVMFGLWAAVSYRNGAASAMVWQHLPSSDHIERRDAEAKTEDPGTPSSDGTVSAGDQLPLNFSINNPPWQLWRHKPEANVPAMMLRDHERIQQYRGGSSHTAYQDPPWHRGHRAYGGDVDENGEPCPPCPYDDHERGRYWTARSWR